MRPHLKCMLRQVAVFKKHVHFWLVSRVPEAIFLFLALVPSMAWLGHPLVEKLSNLVAKARRARGKESPLLRKMENPTSLGTLGILPKTQNSRAESRPPRSKSIRLKLAQLVVDQPHHAPRLRRDQCMLCRQVGHRASECPNKAKPTGFSLGKRAFGTYALDCAVFDSQCFGATVEEIEHDQDEEDIEDFVAFSIRSLEGFAILDGGATKTVSGFLSVQPVANRYEDTTIETTDVGFTFAGGETEAANTKI